MAICHAITNHHRISVGHCVQCTLISNSMHLNMGQANDSMATKWRYHSVEWLLQSCPGKFHEDCSCHHGQISRGLPPLGRAGAHSSPTKKPIFLWWNVQMHSIKRQCCMLTQCVPKFRFVILNLQVDFSNIALSVTREHIMEWINDGLIKKNQFHFGKKKKKKMTAYVHFMHPPKDRANLMRALCWCLCLEKSAITLIIT